MDKQWLAEYGCDHVKETSWSTWPILCKPKHESICNYSKNNSSWIQQEGSTASLCVCSLPRFRIILCDLVTYQTISIPTCGSPRKDFWAVGPLGAVQQNGQFTSITYTENRERSDIAHWNISAAARSRSRATLFVELGHRYGLSLLNTL